MLNARLVLLSACVLALACGSGSQDTPLRPEQSRAIDQLLEGEMRRNQVPGLALAVLRRGGVLVKQTTRGVASLASQAPVSHTTPFQLASTTKSFTASALLILVGEGRVRLTDRVGDRLPGLPPAWQGVTVRQLLSHTSGLPDIVRRPGRLELMAASWEEALAVAAESSIQFAPGERWAYNQMNYALVARLIERLTGKTFEAFVAERLFEPLGMRHTFFPTPGESGPGRTCATNYTRGADGMPVVRSLDFPAFLHSAGGLCSSLEDLVRWNVALDSGRVLRAELMRELWTPATLNDGSVAVVGGTTLAYGLGWVVDETPGHRAVGHSGGNSTGYRRFLDDGFTVIVLLNGDLDPDALLSSVAAIVRRSPGDVGPSPEERLWDAAMSGDSLALEAALEAGADIEALDTRRGGSGRRALNWAAWFDQAEAIRVLLAHGAAIDAVNKTGFSALHHAAESGSRKAAAVLLAAGANRTRANNAGVLPAATARRLGHVDVAVMIEGGPTP